MLRTTVAERGGRKVIVLDSMSQAEDTDRAQVVVAASNGGRESGRIAVLSGCACAVFNDAGIGKDDAGIAGVRAMDAAGVPGLTVGHMSAEISNGMDTWENGVISYVNSSARRAGFQVGAPVKNAILEFLTR